MYCLSPPLDELPQGDWFCPDCIAAANDAEDIGFNSGKTFTIEQFKEECARFDAQFFGQDEPVSIPDIEEAFWKMVEEGSGKTVDVHYGADLDTSVHGSAFPRTWDAAQEGDRTNATPPRSTRGTSTTCPARRASTRACSVRSTTTSRA